MFRNGATMFRSQLGEIGNILAKSRKARRRCELSSTCKTKECSISTFCKPTAHLSLKIRDLLAKIVKHIFSTEKFGKEVAQCRANWKQLILFLKLIQNRHVPVVSRQQRRKPDQRPKIEPAMMF
jgi:hypothetical protein